MSRGPDPRRFRTPDYDGFWLPFEGDRLAFRARIETLLRKELSDPGGRLEVRNDGPHWVGARVQLSYSHSGKQGLLVLSRRGPIGVDIESADRKFTQSPVELAERFFHPGEVERAREPAAFLELWCQKEALGKWSRGGLRESIGKLLAEWDAAVVTVEKVAVVPAGFVACVARSSSSVAAD